MERENSFILRWNEKKDTTVSPTCNKNHPGMQMNKFPDFLSPSKAKKTKTMWVAVGEGKFQEEVKKVLCSC